MQIIKDGVSVERNISITTVSPSVNWAHYTFTDFTFADSIGTGVSAQDDNILRTLRNQNIEARSFLLAFDNNSSASFVLLETHMTAKPRSARYRKSTDIVSS